MSLSHMEINQWVMVCKIGSDGIGTDERVKVGFNDEIFS